MHIYAWPCLNVKSKTGQYCLLVAHTVTEINLKWTSVHVQHCEDVYNLLKIIATQISTQSVTIFLDLIIFFLILCLSQYPQGWFLTIRDVACKP